MAIGGDCRDPADRCDDLCEPGEPETGGTGPKPLSAGVLEPEFEAAGGEMPTPRCKGMLSCWGSIIEPRKS